MKKVYHDVDLDGEKFDEESLKVIEKEMNRQVGAGYSFERKEVSKKEALEVFKDCPYKQELINELEEGEVITIYKLGDYLDLCRGPHVINTSLLKILTIKC